MQDLSYLLFIKTSGVADYTNLGAAFVLLKRAKEVIWLLPSMGMVLISKPFHLRSSSIDRKMW